jgi:uncharacterized membrane protein
VNYLKSKTLWFAVALAVLGAIEMQSQIIPAEYRGHIMILIAGISAVLRVLTTIPLSEK